jgi:hypothetical protein
MWTIQNQWKQNWAWQPTWSIQPTWVNEAVWTNGWNPHGQNCLPPNGQNLWQVGNHAPHAVPRYQSVPVNPYTLGPAEYIPPLPAPAANFLPLFPAINALWLQQLAGGPIL